MLQKTFGIYNDDLADCDFFIETGNDYIACWCKSRQSRAVQAFELFSFVEADALNFSELFKQLNNHSRLLTTKFENTSCIWGHEKSTCLPASFYQEDQISSYLQLMFGENSDSAFCKNTNGEVVTVAVLPANALKEYENHCTVSNSVHKYYQLLKGQQNEIAENKIHLVFYNTHFIISVYKQGVLQAIQTFKYKVSEDVLYPVLNMCKNFTMQVNETKIYASGLVDTASPLYATLYGYLDHFSFEPVDETLFAAEAFHEHPLHYFASFCQYDL